MLRGEIFTSNLHPWGYDYLLIELDSTDAKELCAFFVYARRFRSQWNRLASAVCAYDNSFDCFHLNNIYFGSVGHGLRTVLGCP